MCISLIAEEIFPFGHYVLRSRRKKKQCVEENPLQELQCTDYETVSLDGLKQRLREEHQRASSMDEKTFKLTLSLSVGLTVLGSAAAFLTNMISSGAIQTTSTIVIGCGVLYVLAAGFVALGALRTLPTYGYGTKFLLQYQNDQRMLAEALACQEAMNIIRQLRNETAYQALRNGLCLVYAGIMIIAAMLAYQAFFSEPCGNSMGT